jgi:hypothetical protein
VHETELERERHRAKVAEGLAAALTEAARRVSGYFQSELQRPDWEHKTGKEGLEAALSMLRAQLGPLVTGADCTRDTEVLRRAKALARAIEDLEGHAARGKGPRQALTQCLGSDTSWLPRPADLTRRGLSHTAGGVATGPAGDSCRDRGVSAVFVERKGRQLE